MKHTKLYLHTHKINGLKYLGFTSNLKRRGYEYKNDNSMWGAHLRKYGEDYTTEILYEGDNQELLSNHAIAYSLVHKIWDNSEYANLELENGLNGGVPTKWKNQATVDLYRSRLGEKNGFFGKHHTEKHKQQTHERFAGIPLSEEHKKKLKGPRPHTSGKNSPLWGVHKIGKDAPFYGHKHTSESKRAIGDALRGKRMGVKNSSAVAVIIDGIHYDCIKDAAEARAENRSTVYWRVNSKNFNNYTKILT